MKKRNDGKSFEGLTSYVFEILTANENASVEKDVQLDGADGPRQIDVLVRSQIAGIDLTTIIESRDYIKRLDVTHVDGLHSKMLDVNADKAVLVSRKGFSKTAIRKAARIGITLCTLDGSKNSEKALETVGREIPILIKVISILFHQDGSIKTAKVEGSATAMNKQASIPVGIINGVVLTDRIQSAFLSGEISTEEAAADFEWIPPEITPPYYIGAESDDPKLPCEDLKVHISYDTIYLFGYASDLDGSVIFKNLSQKTEHHIINLSDIDKEIEAFAEYHNLKDIPVPISTIEIHGIAIPKMRRRTISVWGIKYKK